VATTRRSVTIAIHDSYSAWDETYIEGASSSFTSEDTDLGLWALDLVAKFNRGLRPGENKRFIDKVTVGEVEVKDDDFHKDRDNPDDDDDEDEDEDD
jgi:hypothetical protein